MSLSKSTRVLKGERGAVAVIVALLMTVFVGFAAFVVDIGYTYEMRRQLQSAADAAALAGMIEKIQGADEAGVLDVAGEFAGYNDKIDQSETLELLPFPYTEVTEDYVKIGVTKDVHFFFAPIWNLHKEDVAAQAKAKRVYVTGARDMVPWGVNTIRAEDMVVRLEGTEKWFSRPPEGSDSWSALISAPAAPQKDGYLIDLSIVNSQGFETLEPAVGAAGVHAPDDLVTDVYLDDNVLPPPDDPTKLSTKLWVESVAGPPQRAVVGGTTYPGSDFRLDVATGLYWVPIIAPPADGPLKSYAVDVRVGNESYNNVARLIVRTRNSPIEDISFSQLHFGAGGGDILITVEMRDLEYGEQYALKIGDTPEAGNFGSLDFTKVFHPPHPPNFQYDQEDNHGAVPGSEGYLYFVENSYNDVIHIGDHIFTYTGDRGGPTERALESRIGDCGHTLESWLVNKPADCGRLVTVPIVEQITKAAGSKPVYVYGIAEFFIEGDVETDGGVKVDIVGTFIRYVKGGGTSSDTPPDSKLYMETVRLDQADF